MKKKYKDKPLGKIKVAALALRRIANHLQKACGHDGEVEVEARLVAINKNDYTFGILFNKEIK